MTELTLGERLYLLALMEVDEGNNAKNFLEENGYIDLYKKLQNDVK